MDPTSKPPPQAYISREEFFFTGKKTHGTPLVADALRPQQLPLRAAVAFETYRQTNRHTDRQMDIVVA